MMKRKSIAVFCGAKPGNNPKYAALAAEFGVALARQGYRLVYGGGKVGLMGALADGALSVGGEVLGVMPTAMREREWAHTGLTELEIVTSMSVRKDRMIAESDAFVALPGGLGTLDELFEVMTLRQTGYHQKPVALLDQDGYFQPLIAACRAMMQAEFVYPREFDYLIVGTDTRSVLNEIERSLSERSS